MWVAPRSVICHALVPLSGDGSIRFYLPQGRRTLHPAVTGWRLPSPQPRGFRSQPLQNLAPGAPRPGPG